MHSPPSNVFSFVVSLNVHSFTSSLAASAAALAILCRAESCWVASMFLCRAASLVASNILCLASRLAILRCAVSEATLATLFISHYAALAAALAAFLSFLLPSCWRYFHLPAVALLGVVLLLVPWHQPWSWLAAVLLLGCARMLDDGSCPHLHI